MHLHGRAELHAGNAGDVMRCGVVVVVVDGALSGVGSR